MGTTAAAVVELMLNAEAQLEKEIRALMRRAEILVALRLLGSG